MYFTILNTVSFQQYLSISWNVDLESQTSMSLGTWGSFASVIPGRPFVLCNIPFDVGLILELSSHLQDSHIISFWESCFHSSEEGWFLNFSEHLINLGMTPSRACGWLSPAIEMRGDHGRSAGELARSGPRCCPGTVPTCSCCPRTIGAAPAWCACLVGRACSQHEQLGVVTAVTVSFASGPAAGTCLSVSALTWRQQIYNYM